MNTYYELYHGGVRFTANTFEECVSKAKGLVCMGAKTDCSLNMDAFIVKHTQLDGSTERFSLMKVSYIDSESILLRVLM